MNELAPLKERFARPALMFEAANQHFVSHPPSLFGAVTAALPQEDWPHWQGEPLSALLQLNLNDLPFRPPGLQNVAFVSLFVASPENSEKKENGSSWCLRTYKDIAALEALVDPRPGSEMVPLGLPHLVEDFPEDHGGDEKIDPVLWRQFKAQYPTRSGIKLGGWPPSPLVDLLDRHPSNPDFVFQVDFGIGAWAALGRGTKPGMKDKWVLQWQ